MSPSEWINVILGISGLLGVYYAWREHQRAERAESKAKEAEAKAAEAAREEQKKVEEANRRAAAAEHRLLQARRISSGPYFVIADNPFNSLIGSKMIVTPLKGNVLCWLRDEVSPDLQKGTTILLVFADRGRQSQDMMISSKVRPFPVEWDMKIDGKYPGLCVMHYEFDPEKFGQWEEFKLSFTTLEGFRDTHTYEIQHGVRAMRRVSPQPVSISGE